MYGSALNKYAEYLQDGFDSDIETDVEEILLNETANDTEKTTLLKTRIGQGSFRQKLISVWGGFAVTGYKDTAMLVASHIKPWRVSSSSERLDAYNGLLLLPTFDTAFDSGFISFKANGQIIISPLLKEPECLGITKSLTIKPKPQNHHYLEFHRDTVFRSS
jgi:predicted restriction endonuclease